MKRRPPRSTRTDTLFPYTTLFRSRAADPSRPVRRTSRPALYDSRWNRRAGPLSRHRTRKRRAVGVRGRDSSDRAGQDESDSVGSHRSEEHTSELQSLMRISYAVFCLTKKKTRNTTTTTHATD